MGFLEVIIDFLFGCEFIVEKISVIMPAYNVERYIGKSIQSVLSQTYADFELIIVNDGSSDGTFSVVKEYQSGDGRIRYIEQINQGVSVARNTGIEAATGRYISFLDADDLWKCDALEKLYKKMSSVPGCCFVYGRTEEVFTSDNKQIVGPEEIINGYLEDFIHQTNELRLCMHISALLIDRELLMTKNILFKPGIKIAEDTGFMIEVLSATAACGISDVISYYMRREDSVTMHSWQPDAWKGQIIVYDMIHPFVQSVRPQALFAFCCMRNYVAYRFILHCIRNDFFEEVHAGLQTWHDYLLDFARGNGKFLDRVKCSAILLAKKHDCLLRFIGML